MMFNFILQRFYSKSANRARLFLYRTKKLPTAAEHLEAAHTRQLALATRLRTFLGFDPSAIKPELPQTLLISPTAPINNNIKKEKTIWEGAAGSVNIGELTKYVNEKIRNLPYFVERTAYGKSLPVYTRYRHNRQQRFTVLRRIYGCIQSLAQDLRTVFPPEHVFLKERKRQIYVKGLKDLELKYWLADRGF